MTYQINRSHLQPCMDAEWDSEAWKTADTLRIESFLPQCKGHHPATSARLLYDDAGIHGIFLVKDQYVRCVRVNYFDEVWKDSCVEFFVQPEANSGYFNFEFNCGGAFLCNYIDDWTPALMGWKSFVRIPWVTARQIKVRSSLPPVVDPEIAEPINWTLRFFIPFTVFKPFVGSAIPLANTTWRGNFFKCAEEVSHPHWAAWSPVDEFNFHLPRCFGSLRFG
jgi:hypothetical protein